jgi:uncharacterized protein (DUF1501 family)
MNTIVRASALVACVCLFFSLVYIFNGNDLSALGFSSVGEAKNTGRGGGSTVGVTMSASPNNARIGQTVRVTVSASNLNDVAGAQMSLSYDPTRLRYEAVDQGTFLGADGTETYLAPPTVRSNSIDDVVTLRLASTGISGSGSLATVRFTVLTGGTTTVSLNDVLVSSSAGSAIPVGSASVSFKTRN